LSSLTLLRMWILTITFLFLYYYIKNLYFLINVFLKKKKKFTNFYNKQWLTNYYIINYSIAVGNIYKLPIMLYMRPFKKFFQFIYKKRKFFKHFRGVKKRRRWYRRRFKVRKNNAYRRLRLPFFLKFMNLKYLNF